VSADDAAGLMSDRVQIVFERLRREYLDEMPARLAALEAAMQSGDTDALRTGLHQLAGSGGSHGFPGISDAARELERALAAGGSLSQSGNGLAPLRRAVTDAQAEVG
jgi:HPt (histidine-containing phosphotransfer) domain-containing protein